jgi:hypothetical protein
MPDRLSARATIVALLVAAFLAVQLVVPVAALFGPRPARFAWHMYSALPDLPRAWTVQADGTEAPIELSGLFAVQRAEIDYAAVLRTGLCDATGAAAVKIQLAHEAAPEVIACH